MSGYRPITDCWILARSKVAYHGAYPAGFLHRAMALLGVSPQAHVLHVCGGRIRDYPYKGLGPNHRTLDLDPALKPDFLRDCREPLPRRSARRLWDAILIDRPYTNGDAEQYAPGADKLPELNALLKNALGVVAPGGRVAVLDYLWPHPGKLGTEVAVIAVGTGRNGRARWYTVFEKTA